jgi:phasin
VATSNTTITLIRLNLVLAAALTVAKGHQTFAMRTLFGRGVISTKCFVDKIDSGERATGAVDGPFKRNRSGTMSENGHDRFEIPKEMRSMAEASFDQARKAFEQFLSSAQQTAGSLEERSATVRAGAKDIGTKAMSYAEKNVQASLDYAQSLLHAKDLTEIMRLHSEYVQAQMRSLAEQASEMGQIVSRAAMEAAKPKT